MKKGSDLFDVLMDVYNGAEVCELINYIFLNRKNIGFYRDDGLSNFKNCSGPQMEKIKKQLQKVLKSNGLDVIIECNMKTVNYLDVTFNLNDCIYRHYQKSDKIIQCIHIKSNHPPNIIKQIPKTNEKRLSQLPPTKIYSMNQYYSVKINYTSLATNNN